jgi:predicted O-methyltransferase YrrM
MKSLSAEFGIEWRSKNAFQLGDYEFYLPDSFDSFLLYGKDIAPEKLYIAKSVEFIRRYLSIIKSTKPRNIVELGIFRGGSVAFLQLAAKPERFLALEISPDRLDNLDKFIHAEGLGQSLKIAYGVDQANGALVRQITTEHMGEGRCLDLVVDDASHLLAPTRTSFEALFPLIRPGGSFVIEDYAGTHILTANWLPLALKGSASAQRVVTEGMRYAVQEDRLPLHLLAVEAMLGSIVAPGLIERVVVDRHWLRIIRGSRDFESPSDFDLRRLASDHFGLLESRVSNEIARFMDTPATT